MKVGLFLVVAAAPLFAASTGSGDDLFAAVRSGDRAAIERLLKSGAGVNARDAKKGTPLMMAAVSGDAAMLKTLIDAGADVNAADAFGSTALIWSATDPSKVALLLKAGANAKAKNVRGVTALHAAAESPVAFESVRLLVEAGAEVNVQSAFGTTPLNAAANAYCPESTKLLLAKGADPKGADRQGMSDLHGAAQFGDAQIVKAFLAKGADVNAQNKFAGEVKHGKVSLVGLSPLMVAAAYQGVPVVKALLDGGADINRRDVRGMTPLMFAVSSEVQDAAVVKLLLDRGADPAVKSKAGETALDWARKFGNPQVIKLLGGKPETAAPMPVHAALDAREASAKAVALVQRSSTEFFRQSGCVGCHHQNLTAFAAQAARKAGIAVDPKAAAEQVQMVKGQWTAWSRMNRDMWNPPGATDMSVYSLLQLAMENYPADEITDGMLHYVAGKQSADGSWRLYGIARSPIEEGAIHRTALAARAMKIYAPAGRKAEFDERIGRARQYLTAAPVKTTDDAAMKVMGLVWTGVDSAAVSKAVADLEKRQLADGGWGGNRWLASDAYSTALAVSALREAAVASTAPSRTKGADWLLKRQAADGSWKVASRAPKFQPYFESGFPYGNDQWISASATAWAVVALAN